MRVLEVVAVLESVTEHPVEADMGQPDQPERDDQGVALPPADPDQRGRRRRAVPEVVGPRPETWSAEIAEHRDVGQQQQERHEPPGLPDSRIRDRGTNDEGRAFEPVDGRENPEQSLLRRESENEAANYVDDFLKGLHAAVRGKSKQYDRMLGVLWYCYLSPAHITQLEAAARLNVSDSLVSDYRRRIEQQLRALNFTEVEEARRFEVALRERVRVLVFAGEEEGIPA